MAPRQDSRSEWASGEHVAVVAAVMLELFEAYPLNIKPGCHDSSELILDGFSKTVSDGAQ
jgi:hypothetical protein